MRIGKPRKQEITGTNRPDTNASHSLPTKQLMPCNRVASTVTKILSFDPTCVLTRVLDVSNYSGFLTHENPREGGVEIQLSTHNFSVDRDLESRVSRTLPSFQYTVTKTKTKPDYYSETKPSFNLRCTGKTN
jgi:hypothetical protein